MSYSIKVSSNSASQETERVPFFVRDFDSEEDFQRVVNLCDNKRRVGWLEALVIPIRTDLLEEFCKDLFVPSLFHVALKIEGAMARFFLCLFLPIVDLATLPIRCITAIPRSIYNRAHSKESHPFYRYLINNGVSAADLSAGSVYLELKWEEYSEDLEEESREEVTQEATLNLMELPTTHSPMSCRYREGDVLYLPMRPFVGDRECG